VVRKVWVTRRR